ncbi:MAG: SsrA-binding protein SmpB [Atribacterota bacterium]|jgi:SsrA-binding protein|nr:SsrA-binding protein SmpB [Atribacterota bacterium]MDD4896694.1 SsrA-binding protein SmpB [Atribacterota bacterium]MDD5637692.1 SsrA-binding protein SmpB [Atribacterota bacterium]
MSEKDKEKYQIITINRKARHDYHILESFEAGLVLKGTEVKSIRNNQVSIKESYAQFKGNELYIINMHIAPYQFGNRFNLEPKRERKLLLSSRELAKIRGNVELKGVTIVPLRLYFKNGYAKLEIALAKGKKLYDKRRDLTQKAIQREAERELKNKVWGR